VESRFGKEKGVNKWLERRQLLRARRGGKKKKGGQSPRKMRSNVSRAGQAAKKKERQSLRDRVRTQGQKGLHKWRTAQFRRGDYRGGEIEKEPGKEKRGEAIWRRTLNTREEVADKKCRGQGGADGRDNMGNRK